MIHYVALHRCWKASYVITRNEANKTKKKLNKRIRGNQTIKKTIIIRKLYYYKKKIYLL